MQTTEDSTASTWFLIYSDQNYALNDTTALKFPSKILLDNSNKVILTPLQHETQFTREANSLIWGYELTFKSALKKL